MRDNNQTYQGQKVNQSTPQQSKQSSLPNTYNSYGQPNTYNPNYAYPYYQPQNYQHQSMTPPPNYQYYNGYYAEYNQLNQQQYPVEMMGSRPGWQGNSQAHSQLSHSKGNKGNNFQADNYRRADEKPIDPRKRSNYKHQNKSSRSYNQDKKEKKQRAFMQRNDRHEDSYIENQSLASDSQKQSQSEDEQILYQKSKAISKKRDPVLDTPQQIKKWIEARKRNYPFQNQPKSQAKAIEGEMSILQSKIRKKIMLVTSDGRGLMKKLKNMHILKRLVAESQPDIRNKNKKNNKQKVNQIKELKMKEKAEETPKQKKIKPQEPINDQSSQNQQAVEKPVIKEADKINEQINKPSQLDEINNKTIKSGLTPEDMVAHLKQKQKQDKQFYDQLLNYRTNSLNYRYSSQTLQTNFVLEDIFEESSYLLQIIRYLVKNDFFGRT